MRPEGLRTLGAMSVNPSARFKKDHRQPRSPQAIPPSKTHHEPSVWCPEHHPPISTPGLGGPTGHPLAQPPDRSAGRPPHPPSSRPEGLRYPGASPPTPAASFRSLRSERSRYPPRMPQSLSRILTHLVFSTKNRAPCLTPEIQRELHPYLAGVLDHIECPALRVGGVEDHVNLFFGLSRTLSIAEVVEKVKTSSSNGSKARRPLSGLPLAERLWSLLRQSVGCRCRRGVCAGSGPPSSENELPGGVSEAPGEAST